MLVLFKEFAALLINSFSKISSLMVFRLLFKQVFWSSLIDESFTQYHIHRINEFSLIFLFEFWLLKKERFLAVVGRSSLILGRKYCSVLYFYLCYLKSWGDLKTMLQFCSLCVQVSSYWLSYFVEFSSFLLSLDLSRSKPDEWSARESLMQN